MHLPVRLTQALILLVICTSSAQAEERSHYTRELWSGTFTQHGMVEWEGPMELYIRYDDDASLPQPFEGVITWKKLGNTRTRVSGMRGKDSVSFTELDCLAGDCTKVMLGGSYQGKVRGARLEGKAQLPLVGLIGKFKLRKR